MPSCRAWLDPSKLLVQCCVIYSFAYLGIISLRYWCPLLSVSQASGGNLAVDGFTRQSPTGKTPQVAPVRGYVAWTSGRGSRNYYTLPCRLQLFRLDLWTYCGHMVPVFL